uniref:Zinc finger Mcm10/DnaG-type domain-containing protein n=1 Tax=Mycena chlorophos TaxID=658473 RepID=A0ABQ0L460_MYCCL|nr:predicted protein [Mycena chlorophos]
MEFVANTERQEKQKRAELKRQIAQLQAQMDDMPDSDPDEPPSPKRQKTDNVLAPATPSPKKKTRPPQQQTRPALQSLAKTAPPKDAFVPFRPTASTVLSRLAQAKPSALEAEVETVPRSGAFTDAPKAPNPVASTSGSSLQRDDRLAIVDSLEMGPYEHKPPFDDPRFEQVEPNSGIRLSSRVVSHEDVQDYLRGRYYLSPSKLYSCIRLLPNKQGYDVPVDADWITIAVVAERGPYKYSRAPVEINGNDDDDEGKKKKPNGKGKEKEKDEPERKSSGKRYVNIKLSDGYDLIEEDDGTKRKLYRGGSRGAFEEVCDVKEGTVLALLNPRVLKPFQRSNDNPHPTSNILAVSPDSASAVLVLGHARDLGRCSAERRDGSVCGSWFDKRVSEVCDWHVQYAVTQRRAGRAEFSAATSGLGTSAKAPKRKNNSDYDPRRKWGLAPLDADKGPTYVMGGHVVLSGGGGVDAKESMRATENMGREGQAKASRQMAARDDEKRLLRALGERLPPSKEKDKAPAPAPPPTATKPRPTKSAYTPELIQRIGFDPTLKPGQRRISGLGSRDKMDQLERLTDGREVKLGPTPGERLRTTVRVPDSALKAAVAKPDVDLDSEDELPPAITLSKNEPMVDLDDD